MKLPFSTIILVILVLIFSVFFANISNLIAIQVENSIVRGDLSKDVPNEIYNAEFESENEATKEEVTIGDSFEHLMWFVQVIICCWISPLPKSLMVKLVSLGVFSSRDFKATQLCYSKTK